MLLRQSEARCDPFVGAEQLAEEIWAVALLAAMQQHYVVWQSARAVEEFAYGCQGLEVGKVALAGST